VESGLLQKKAPFSVTAVSEAPFSLLLISVQNSKDMRLRIHILGIPCLHHSQAAYSHIIA
jgi:hypothetical protein